MSERITVSVIEVDAAGGMTAEGWHFVPGQFGALVALLTEMFGCPPRSSGLASGEAIEKAFRATNGAEGFTVVSHDG